MNTPIPYPGHTADMAEQPHDEMRGYVGRGLSKVAGLSSPAATPESDAVAVAFAKEGADVSIVQPRRARRRALHTATVTGAAGRTCALFPGDLGEPAHCREVVARTLAELGGLDIVVNNAAYQAPTDDLTDITDEQWRRTFAVNIDSYFQVTKSALPHLPDGAAIINTTSVNGLRGNASLIDYSATKGAVIACSPTRWPSHWRNAGSGRTALPRAGLDAAHTGHHAAGEGRVVRRERAIRPAGPTGRDRPVVRILRRRPVVVVLQR